MTVRILAIHAHPDDLEILAAGTLAHLIEPGPLDYHCDHDRRAIAEPPSTIRRDCPMRREEARDAAKLIGATYVARNSAILRYLTTIRRGAV